MSADPSPESVAASLERAVLDCLHQFDDPILTSYLQSWPAPGWQVRPWQPRTLPVTDYLPLAVRASVPATAPLVSQLSEVAGALFWGQTYSAGDFGADFLTRYGWSELVGQRGPLPSEAIACGFLMLGPDTDYPKHRHAAEELYLPLCGDAAWQRGDAAWTTLAPGTLIHHAPWVPHAMRTARTPMVALYLWRGGDLSAKSEIG